MYCVTNWEYVHSHVCVFVVRKTKIACGMTPQSPVLIEIAGQSLIANLIFSKEKINM